MKRLLPDVERKLGLLGRVLLSEIEMEPCARCGEPKADHVRFGGRLLCHGPGSDLDYLPRDARPGIGRPPL